MNLLKCDSWAVILNNSDKESKAYKILDELKRNMYKVVAIDEEKKPIEGIDVYECLKDVPPHATVLAHKQPLLVVQKNHSQLVWQSDSSNNSGLFPSNRHFL